MDDAAKARQLKNHKMLATGLFLLMVAVYALATWLEKQYAFNWTGYVRAFSEAAMVGALADWFAVTALFHHPLRLRIPHTNLIENSKDRIGDNLGNFVVSNFLTPATIRPYVMRLSVSDYLVKWLGKEKNKQLLLTESTALLNNILLQTDDAMIARFMADKGALLLQSVKLNVLAADGLSYFLDAKMQQQLVVLLAQKVKAYIGENQDLVREKVKSESYFFIPSFVDNKLAEKITTGLEKYLDDIAQDENHRIYTEVNTQVNQFAAKLKTEPEWEETFQGLSNKLLPPAKMEKYATAAWAALKKTLQNELTSEQSMLRNYIYRSIDDIAAKLGGEPATRNKIDHWVQLNAYKYLLRNAKQIGVLISDTVGNWQGRELSHKLELEVGKDLQYIRINGTLVGGLVGLIIYIVTKLLG